MPHRLTGTVALVGGGTSGIGRASVELFAAEGAKVIFSGRREAEGRQVEAQVRSSGGEAVFVRGDFLETEDMEQVVRFAIERYGRIDVLMNNAGGGTKFNLHEMDLKTDYEPWFALNVRSYFYMTKLVLPYMMEQRSGSIINVSSVSSVTASPKKTVYSATKGAITMFTQSVACEYAKYNIRCNAISPGMTYTGLMPRGSMAEKTSLSVIPMGRGAEPVEIAQAACFFASDECTCINGVNLLVDGGQACGTIRPETI